VSKGGHRVLLIGLDGLMPEMVLKFSKEGILPNMGRLIDQGCFSISYPDPPVDTPTNWTCLATGARMGSHGVHGFGTHLPGEPIGRIRRISHSLGPSPASMFQNTPNEVAINWLCQAEYLWEAATKAGKKCIVVDWPGGYPARMEGIQVVDGSGPYCSIQARFLPPHRFTTIEGEEAKGTLKIEFKEAEAWANLPPSGPPPLESTILVSGQYLRGGRERPATPGERAGMADVLIEEPPAEAVMDRWAPTALVGSADLSQVTYHLLLVGEDGKGYDRLLISRSRNASQKLAVLRVGEWSPWLREKMRVRAGYRRLNAYDLPVTHADVDIEFMFKFRLLALSPDGRQVVLYRTSLFNAQRWTSPEGLAEELIDGLFQESQRQGLEGLLGDEVVLEHHPGILGAFWHPGVSNVCLGTPLTVKMLAQRGDWDALFVQIHAPDGINHRLLTYIDPQSSMYRPELAEKVWDEFRAEYSALDGAVGAMMEAGGDEDTVIGLVSDHAAFPVRRQFWPVPALAEAGLVALEENPATGLLRLNPKKCKIFSLGGGFMIHDQARFKEGIVEPKEMEEVAQKAIAALYLLRDPLTGQCPISAALTLNDASLLGQWGGRCPDVLFFLAPGYGLFGPRGEFPKEALAGPIFRDLPEETGLKGQHGGNLPQAVMKEEGFSARAVFIFKGLGVKRGYMRRQACWTVDVVPTLAHLAGLPFPRHCEGRVLTDALEGWPDLGEGSV